MVERAPSPSTVPPPTAAAPPVPVAGPDVPANLDPSPVPSPSHSTYVVQVAKDQVYRVPPPENAYLVEQYRNKDKNQRRKSPCISCLKWILVAALLILLLVVVAVIVFVIVMRRATPAFNVQHLFVTSPRSGTKSLPKPEYDFTLSASNPSQNMGYSYKAGGRAAAAHDSIEIAVGTTPGFYQEHQNATAFRLVLRGSNVLLPKAIDRSLKGSKDVVRLALRAKFSVNPRVGGLELWAMSVEIACDVRVTGLVKEARISSQDCKAALLL